MLGRRGQAFDAFKLLIAAVVAGAILVIILSILGGITSPGGNPITVSAQLVQQLNGAPGSGMVSTQIVNFRKGMVVGASSIANKAGANPSTVHFCTKESSSSNKIGGCADSCPKGYVFNSTFFTVSDSSLTANSNLHGKMWVFNCNGQFYVGFTTNTTG